MSIDTRNSLHTEVAEPSRWRWLDRLRERRRLRRLVQQQRQRAQLLDLLGLLSTARATVEGGWVQNAWFEYKTPSGEHVRAVGGWASRIRPEDVTGACLVGAIVLAGGGPSQAHSTRVQRALDITWHALEADERDAVRWCPDPASRMENVRDLSRWNDEPGRSPDDVAALLLTAERVVNRELVR